MFWTLLFVSLLIFVAGAQAGVLPDRALSLYALVIHAIRKKSRFTPKKKRKFNFNEIRRGIIVGTQPRVEAEIGQLKLDFGVTAILSLNENHELYVPHTTKCFKNVTKEDITDEKVPIGTVRDERMLRLGLPVPDYQGPSQEVLEIAVRFIDAQVRSGGKVFVHCNGGKGRSMAAVLAYFLATDCTGKQTVKDLWSECKEKRKQTASGLLRYPLTSQARSLKQFEYANKKQPIVETFKRVKLSKLATELPEELLPESYRI